MQFYSRFFLLFFCAASTALAAAKTQTYLILSAETARPGETIFAGIQMQMPPRWHTYWKNSGDSGSPAEIKWNLPEGISAGEIQWPIPRKQTDPAGDTKFITYVLSDEAVLIVPLKIASTISPGEKKIRAKVSWQECETICILGEATVNATLTIGADSKPSPNFDLIQEAQKKLPVTNLNFSITSLIENISNEKARLSIELSGKSAGGWDFFPYTNNAAEINGETESASIPDGSLYLRKQIKKTGAEWPKEISGVLVELKNGEPVAGYEISLRPKIFSANNSNETSTGKKSLWLMLLSAFLGGLILNIMPCVLPVIALKVLSFVNQSKESPARGKALGLIYGVGVLVSFLVLALLAIAVQKAGGLASWGMVLQNQIFRVVLTVLITLVALNLFGLFEITLSGSVMGAAGNLSAQEGFSGAFFNGVLATILATPCTAPFLAGAIGFAFTQPPLIIVLMFLMAGLGLAAPFVILCWNPKWLKILPQPGAWMEKFKIAMGFPMLATAIWIFWFTAPRFGKSGVLWLGLFLVILSAAAWVWGEFVQRGRQRKSLAIVFTILLLSGGYIFALEKKLNWRAPVTFFTIENSLKESPDGINWQRWSPEAVAKARAEGHVALVDFTADNCLNCQLNKASSLEIPATRAKLKEIGAVAFIGDFTDNNPRIAAELRRYERAGVPLVLVYPKDLNSPPIILPPILTPGIVSDALEKAAK
ncbi:MAG: thioredoxin family protein [Verrucomicrobiota bacterium]|nr:thioredoxin family protein [Verrucomicrobiota bacterium]